MRKLIGVAIVFLAVGKAFGEHQLIFRNASDLTTGTVRNELLDPSSVTKGGAQLIYDVQNLTTSTGSSNGRLTGLELFRTTATSMLDNLHGSTNNIRSSLENIVSSNIVNNGITGGDIGLNVIVSSHIVDNAITGSDVGLNVIVSSHIHTTANIGFGTNSPTSKLDVLNGSVTIRGSNAGLQIGATNFMVSTEGTVQIGTNSVYVDPSSGWVGFGSTTPIGVIDVYTSSNVGLSFRNSSNAPAQRPIFTAARSRGINELLPLPVQDGDNLMALISFAFVNGVYRPVADFHTVVDGVPSATSYPARINFTTTNQGATSRTTKMTITHNGFVGINASSPTSMLEVSGGSVSVRGTNAGVLVDGRVHLTKAGEGVVFPDGSRQITSAKSGFTITAGSSPLSSVSVDIASNTEQAIRTAITSMTANGLRGTVRVPASSMTWLANLEIPYGITVEGELPGVIVETFSSFNVASVSGTLRNFAFRPKNQWNKDYIVRVNGDGGGVVDNVGLASNFSIGLPGGSPNTCGSPIVMAGLNPKAYNLFITSTAGSPWGGTDIYNSFVSFVDTVDPIVRGGDIHSETDTTMFRSCSSTGAWIDAVRVHGARLGAVIHSRGRMAGSEAGATRISVTNSTFVEDQAGQTEVAMYDYSLYPAWRDNTFINKGTITGTALNSFGAPGISTGTSMSGNIFHGYSVGINVPATAFTTNNTGNNAWGAGVVAVSDSGNATRNCNNANNGTPTGGCQ